MLGSASISNPNVNDQNARYFNKHGSTGKLPRPRPTDIIYVIVTCNVSKCNFNIFNENFQPFMIFTISMKNALILTHGNIRLKFFFQDFSLKT